MATDSVTSPDELDLTLEQGWAARRPLAALTPTQRKDLLAACAVALESAADDLVAIAMEETNLPEARLRGEISRTTHQLRLYGASAAATPSVEVDPADPAGAIPHAELRRTTRPIGLVLVFAASNFPFAFSVAGTDTASAIAAGCPVVVKAHPGHPRLSEATAAVMGTALAAVGAPAGTFALIAGMDAGVRAIQDPRVSAAAFTGSLAGGRRLLELATLRDAPIPFYGELGSMNPVVVGPAAAASRAEEILDGYAASFTLGAGQFCTKPGVLFWPDAVPLPDAWWTSVEDIPVHPMLNEGLRAAYQKTLNEQAAVAGFDVAVSPTHGATVLTTTAAAIQASRDSLEECFGPATVVARYTGTDDLRGALEMIPGTLTATVHADQGDEDWTRTVLPCLEERAGRVIWGQWPTGVAVTRAQHHGGPFPATTSPLHTSVGTHAMDRFMRPITYQNFPPDLLPDAARDDSMSSEQNPQSR